MFDLITLTVALLAMVTGKLVAGVIAQFFIVPHLEKKVAKLKGNGNV